MLEIDGSQGEGGGQLLRSALSLSLITAKPFRITRIRSNRSKPGLMRQHLVAVQAAGRICGAELSGAELGSSALSFEPRRVRPGSYSFDIGSAGSTPLVLQTVIPPLLLAEAPSRLTLTGGTHVPFSPSWQYLAEVFAPTLRRLGGVVELAQDSCGFYPKGGGKVRCGIEPAAALQPIDAQTRGRLLRIRGYSVVAQLPLSIAERQSRAALERLRASLGAGVPIELVSRECRSIGPGTFLFLKGEYESALSGCTALGARGKPAEQVGEEAALEFLQHHDTGQPVDPHLADQLVLYLALAAGPSLFATSRITGHLLANLELVGSFLELEVRVTGAPGGPGTVGITPKGARP